MKTNYVGIDYGGGTTNVDNKTGIRYGVISQNEVCQAWCDSAEAYYGDPRCPKCGNDAVVVGSEKDTAEDDEGNAIFRNEYESMHHACGDFACDNCEVLFDGEDAFGDAISHFIDNDEYGAECDESGDIFVMRSPYYTRAQFCSPCAPGAGYLMNPCDDGERAYCLGHEFFDNDEAPYPVYRVSDHSMVEPKKE